MTLLKFLNILIPDLGLRIFVIKVEFKYLNFFLIDLILGLSWLN